MISISIEIILPKVGTHIEEPRVLLDRRVGSPVAFQMQRVQLHYFVHAVSEL